MEINPVNVQNRLWTIQMGGLERAQELRPATVGGIEAPQKSEFGSMVAEELDKVNTQLNAADKGVADLATGQSDNIHGTLIAMQKANLSLRMLVEVRNKALSAYEELMRMQA